MKKLFSLFAAFLFVGSMWADTYTLGWGTASGAAGTFTNYTAATGSVTNLVSFSCNQNDGTTAPTYNSNNKDLRLYYDNSGNGNGGSITLTLADDVTVTGFVLTSSTAPSVKYSVDDGTATSVSASDNVYTVTGISASSSITIQNVNTSNTQLRIKTIEITYTSGAPTLSSIAISGDLTKKTYDDEATLDYSGLTVTGTYSDDSHADLTSSAEWSYAPALSVGLTSVTVTATVGGKSADKAITGLTVTKHVVVPDEYGFDLNASFFGTTAGSNIPGTVSHKKDDVTFEIGTASGTKPRTDEEIVRFYKNNYLTLSVPDGFEITDVKLTISEATWVTPFATVDVMQDETTWKGFANSVTFVFAGTSFVDSVYVTYATADSDAGRISISPNYVSSKPEGDAGSMTLSYTNISDIDDDIVLYDDLNKTSHVGAAWVHAEWNQDKSVINYVVDPNTGNTDRTVYLYIYAMDDQAEDVEKFIIVTQSKCDFAILPFTFDGGKGDITSTTGLTQSGLDSDYGSSPKLKFNSTGDNVILKIGEAAGTLSFKIKGNDFSGGTFKVQASVDGSSYTDLESYTSLGDATTKSITTIDKKVRYIKWVYTTKVDGNVALGNISLAKPVPSALETADSSVKSVKFIQNGQLFIEQNGHIYNVMGQLVK